MVGVEEEVVMMAVVVCSINGTFQSQEYALQWFLVKFLKEKSWLPTDTLDLIKMRGCI